MISSHKNVLILFNKITTDIILLASIVILFPKNVYAYLDMGTGSYIIQVVIAAIFGGLFAIKLFWNKIKKYFLNLLSMSKTNDED